MKYYLITIKKVINKAHTKFGVENKNSDIRRKLPQPKFNLGNILVLICVIVFCCFVFLFFLMV